MIRTYTGLLCVSSSEIILFFFVLELLNNVFISYVYVGEVRATEPAFLFNQVVILTDIVNTIKIN